MLLDVEANLLASLLVQSIYENVLYIYIFIHYK